MVVGGFERVFEIGKQFRNEDIDTTHHPEFTTCEFYMAYGTLEQAIDMTETLIRDIVSTTTGSLVLETSVKEQPYVLDFSRPFSRLDITSELERHLGPLPDLNNPASLGWLLEKCQQHQVCIGAPKTLGRVMDGLISHFIEPQCIQPTFLMGHPVCLSPLAKERSKGLAARFELFIGTKEFANAYIELNNPIEQRERFAQQAQEKAQGDLEAQSLDESFCDALALGLPPTVGWGLGIDRLVMLVTKSKRIREVIGFPIMKPVS